MENGNSVVVDERAAGVFLGADPYRELELYLEKVKEEIGEVFDQWRTADVERNKCRKIDQLSNGYRAKHYSDSDVELRHRIDYKNHKINKKSQNGYNSNGKKVNCEDDVNDEGIDENVIAELNDIAKLILDLSSKNQSVDMPYYGAEDSGSDHDYDDVFESDDETANDYSKSPNHEETQQNGISIQQNKLQSLFSYNLTPTKTTIANFLKKNKERVPSLTDPLPGEAILTKVASLPDTDFVRISNPESLNQRRSTDPEIPKLPLKCNGSLRDPLLTKRKLLSSTTSKSLTNSPQLPPKNQSHAAYLTWSKALNLDDDSAPIFGSVVGHKIGLKANKSAAKSSDLLDNWNCCKIDSSADKCNHQQANVQSFANSTAKAFENGFVGFPEVEECIMRDMETQTANTPPLSRSSSCTCLSECSSSVFNTGSNPSGSEDEAATVDDDIRSSSSSGNDGGRNGGGEESGIGTASPPPRQRKDLDKGQSGLNKCKRKETWERLRRKHSNAQRHPLYRRLSSGTDVWVRRTSVMTQTLNLEDDQATSDHTYNTEEMMSSNENFPMDFSPTDASASDNSLRKRMFSRKYNEENQSSSGLDSSVNTVDESNEECKHAKAVRPTFLHLKTSNSAPSSAESPISSADCLDDPTAYKGFMGQRAGRDQPSPSTASLKLSMAPLPTDLGSKCSSVPVLLRQHSAGRHGVLKRQVSEESQESIPHRTRAQSEKQISEIEATEACKWLRAAGFPQYAQMYEDMQFPIDVSGVQSDHPFLDADSLQSLYRRLAALNRCANMKLEHQHAPKHTQHEESDEENQCALSENWQYERKSRRWSRVVVEINPQAQQRLQAIADRAIAEQNARAKAERLETDLLTVPGQEAGSGNEDQTNRFRRSGSERFREGAKAFLRRVESMKSKRRRRHNRDGVVISSPQVLDVDTMNEKMKDLNCFDVSPSANIEYIDFPCSPLRSHPPSPLATMPSSPMTSLPPSFVGQVKLSPTPFGDDSSSYCSDGSQGSGHRTSTRSKIGSRAKKLLHKSIRADDSGAMSDSECQPSSWRHHYFKDANSNNTKVVLVEPPSPPEGSKRRGRRSPCPSPTPPQRARSKSPIPFSGGRTSSLNFGKEKFKDGALKREKSVSGSELSGSQESHSSQHEESHDKIHSDITTTTSKNSNVQRWHSFQRSSSLGSRPESALVLPIPSLNNTGEDLGAKPMAAMSCGQLQVLRKLALLKLTGYMEKNCPTHRTGWNWELPKFIRKIKAPDYKDKTVFGVPLLVSLQRTGHALPKPIRTALSWLRNNALDQIGIFRKAGVRSRTLRLRQLAETAGITGAGNTHNTAAPPPSPASLSPYDEQQAHDVADMVKQYFRELPDALLTNKLSETFIAIFQHVPQEFREEAVQYALLLLPEEHREALQVVLAFLQQVADHSATNQMTASNLAVCLAPTLLRLHHHQQGQGNSNKEGNSNRSASASPRRKRGGAGNTTRAAAPDPRELNESKAAHDCLLFLIKKHRDLFTISSETLQQCTFTSFEESIPVTLEDLGSEFPNSWKDYQQASTQALLKEAREKSRGWVSVSTHEPHVDLCYRKVGDGHPLRLWRVTTEVEAPPREVLHRILRERQIWDDSLLKCRIVQRLDTQAEVFQYVTASMAPLQAKDYCVLRSWQSDLPRGGCCVVETSVSHSDAAIMLGGVRAVVLASRYLIEPAGKGRSRLVHLARVDTKGRTPEWYNKSYGHLCSLYSARIRASFKHNTDGPESNV